MASILNPYLSFDGNAREAMEFYHRVFGGELSLNTFADFGMADDPDADRIMHGQLEAVNGMTLMGADIMSSMEFRPGNTFTISLSGDDAELLRDWWGQLSEGGQVTTPLARQVWGADYGACVDRFGVAWLVNIAAADEGQAPRE